MTREEVYSIWIKECRAVCNEVLDEGMFAPVFGRDVPASHRKVIASVVAPMARAEAIDKFLGGVRRHVADDKIAEYVDSLCLSDAATVAKCVREVMAPAVRAHFERLLRENPITVDLSNKSN